MTHWLLTWFCEDRMIDEGIDDVEPCIDSDIEEVVCDNIIVDVANMDNENTGQCN